MQTILIKRLIFFSLFLSLFFSFIIVALGQLGTGSSVSAEIKSKIVTGTAVRVRAEPNLSAKEVARLNLGTVVKSSERSTKKEKVGQKEDYWYKVATPQGQRGWVFGGFLLDYDANKRETIYLRIAADRLKTEGADFDDYSDLYNFLNRVAPQVAKQEALSAELELYKLQALAKSLENIPFDNKSQSLYSDWTKTHDAKIVYSEPAGQWFVRAELFWNLSARYRALPIAERIAWAAAETPLPGECEGYMPCYIYLSRITLGEYLKRYPQGDRAEEALRELSESLAPIVADLSEQKVYVPPQDEAERKEMRKNVAELRAILQKCDGPVQQIALNQLNQISKTYP
jgi:hypothetical protein